MIAAITVMFGKNNQKGTIMQKKKSHYQLINKCNIFSCVKYYLVLFFLDYWKIASKEVVSK